MCIWNSELVFSSKMARKRKTTRELEEEEEYGSQTDDQQSEHHKRTEHECGSGDVSGSESHSTGDEIDGADNHGGPF
ncbi:hypothetical protein AAHA92_02669 [Salvia divinorum]|uniref:Uncharacterized protein n=1 Tax=Salvia divinorum TaxID=28513 RepID=A0ABD1IEM3_SALDI